MKGEFPDIPFVLVGAGPSLDESIEFLKSVQDKAIIISSNSPYRKLINSGIRPHMVVTADPMPPTLAGLKASVWKACLWLVRLAPTRKSYGFSPGRIFSWCTFNPIVDLVVTWDCRLEQPSWSRARYRDAFWIFPVTRLPQSFVCRSGHVRKG